MISELSKTWHAIQGLGRNENMLNSAVLIIQQALQKKIGLVLDGDALYLLALAKNRNLLAGQHAHSDVILTPSFGFISNRLRI